MKRSACPLRASPRSRTRTLVIVSVIAFGMLPAARDAAAQTGEPAVRTPPAWPTPEEYLSNRNRVEGGAAPAPGVPAGQPPLEKGAAEIGSAEEVERTAVPKASGVYGLPPFTVQLAAFRRYPSAAAFAGELSGEGVSILGSLRDGEQWYVVLLGLYETRSEAAAAEAHYLRRYPAASTWLRGTSDLRRTEPPGD